MNPTETQNQVFWFVMRDLKRANAKLPAYRFLGDLNFEVFTPMKWQLSVKAGKQIREKVPVVRDLLFVHTTRKKLDPVVEKNPTIQYCYQRGGYRNPMTVPEADMEQFIGAVNSSDTPMYYLPGEITPDMYGRMARIIGGSLNNYKGRLLKMRGSGKKRLIVELSRFMSVAVEVDSTYIELIPDE
jgi:hypothetical protein